MILYISHIVTINIDIAVSDDKLPRMRTVIALRNFTVIEQRWNANLHPQSHDCVNWRCHMISAATTTLASRPRRHEAVQYVRS